jgi:hypothetical protein
MDEPIPCPSATRRPASPSASGWAAPPGRSSTSRPAASTTHWLTPLAKTLPAPRPATVPAAQLAPA